MARDISPEVSGEVEILIDELGDLFGKVEIVSEKSEE